MVHQRRRIPMRLIRIIEISDGSGYWDERKQIEGHYFFLLTESEDIINGKHIRGGDFLIRIQDPLLLFRKSHFSLSCLKYEEICNLSE